MAELRKLLISMKEETKINFGKVTTYLETLQSEFASMKTEVEDLKQSVDFTDNKVSASHDETIPAICQQLKQEIADLLIEYPCNSRVIKQEVQPSVS